MEGNLNLFVVIGAALIDSINPCAIGVLVFLLAYLTKMSGNRSRMILVHGMMYLSAVFFTYLLAGVLLLPVIQTMRNFSVNAYIFIAAIVAFFGVMELKDFFFPGKHSFVSIRPKHAKKIKAMIEKVAHNVWISFGLGVFVALVELPCTGAVYLAVLALMSFSGLNISNMTLLILYNFIFIFPLIIILILYYRGLESEKIKAWKDKWKPYMRLLTGLLLLSLAAWMYVFIAL